MAKEFKKGKMVPVPSHSIVPERDVNKLPVLECQHLGIDFGGLPAVNEFNLTIGRTEIAGLIGPNGAGKTTVFNLLTKVYQPTRGTILLNGKDTHGMSTAQVNRAGIARTFQNIRLFSNLSVEDNVKIGLHNQIRYPMWDGVLRLPKFWKQEKLAHESAMELLAVENYDLVVLDLNLPGEDGMTVLRTLRKNDDHTKVLILSARCDVMDKVDGLDAGADDYLTKPFHLEELAARIRNLTLRRYTKNDVVLTCGKLSFDTKARRAAVGEEILSLTRKETGILEYLMLHPGRPVSQEELMDHVWDNSVDRFSNSIRVHISALRKKLRRALGYDPIHNRIGEGYVMEDRK